MKERFILDRQENILFINFAGLRIESRAQVDEMARFVREAYEARGGRMYAVVNYEGTEIAPEMIDYYGERIKELHDRYGLTTVRYSSSGFTRSVLRYLGAAKDLESNTFVTREEAIRAIRELKDRSQTEIRAERRISVRHYLDPRRSVLGKTACGWLFALLLLLAGYLWAMFTVADPDVRSRVQVAVVTATITLLAAGAITGAILLATVVRPLRQMETLARRLVVGRTSEPVAVSGDDEVGRLARELNEAARHLRQEIERLSGLYHISLMMGTGTEVSKVCELLTGKIARLLGAEMCVILLYDERDRTIFAQLPAYGVSDEQLARLRASLEQKIIATRVFTTGEPYLTNEAVSDPLISQQAVETLGVREMLAVPLRAGERTLGTLEVMNRTGGFLEEDKHLVTIFAAQAAQLLANAQLLENERQLAQQLIASERLAAVGELVAGVAHEVRNPLFGITTTLSALSRKLADREAVQPFLDVVNTEADHLNHLMEQLLEHSRPTKFDPAEADIREVIREALVEFKLQAEAKQIALTCDCRAEVPLLRFDRRKLHGVFVNLLDNAIRHTGASGEVRITASPMQGNADVRIEISDTGAGIAPENVGKVFEPFFTTRDTGTGLGLAITRKTIHDHGGAITVHSEPGKGTSFVITLPAAD